jgi:glycosyltransferase involved in cell wall biosynthesis
VTGPRSGAPAAPPLVSVVTPFYNTDAYLAECIESVLRQTYRDWEYVLVDNCSTDASLAIARSYARQDPRLRVISNAEFFDQDRNLSEGLHRIGAGSRYVKLVLADDFLLPRCLEEMVAVAEAHPSVGLVGSYYLKGDAVMGTGLPYPSPVVPGRELCRLHHLRDLFFFGSPSVVLMRAEIARSRFPFYDSRSPNADTEACYLAMREWDFGFVHQVLSYLRVSEQSRTGSASAFAAYKLDKFVMVTKYGRDCLNEDEFAVTYRRLRAAYYDVLAGGVLSFAPRTFWDFHRAGLAWIGHRLQWPRVVWHALLKLGGMVVSPAEGARRVWRSASRRLGLARRRSTRRSTDG